MRVDYDQVKIKDLDASSNPLLNKRRKKAATGEKSGGSGCSSQWETNKWEGWKWNNCWKDVKNEPGKGKDELSKEQEMMDGWIHGEDNKMRCLNERSWGTGG